MDIRMHGRGGQGIVTLAELTALAAFDCGHEAQAIPSFGSERMGAPVLACCRIGDRPISSREPVTRPDVVVVCDPTLLHSVQVFEGLSPAGWALLNSSRSPSELGLTDLLRRLPAGHLLTLPASELARRIAGSTRANSALFGGLAALTGLFSMAAVDRALHRRFEERVADGQLPIAQGGFDEVSRMLAASHA
jgi:pyruvate ferredoxin oxidoreductase gamma subunit